MTIRLKTTIASIATSLVLLAGASHAETAMEQAMLVPGEAAEVLTEQARGNVDGAQTDLADAKAYLAELEGGDFSNIFVVDDDGSLRCGEPAANPGCAPLTEKDKRESIAEAREFLSNARAQLTDAKSELANVEGVKSAEIEPTSARQ